MRLPHPLRFSEGGNLCSLHREGFLSVCAVPGRATAGELLICREGLQESGKPLPTPTQSSTGHLAFANEDLQHSLEIDKTKRQLGPTDDLHHVWKSLPDNCILRFGVDPQFPHEAVTRKSCFEV